VVYLEAKSSIAATVLVTGLFLVAIPLSVKANILSGIFGTTEEIETLTVVPYIKTDSIYDVPVLNSVQHADPNRARGGGEVLVDDGVLVSTGPVGADKMSTKRSSGEISVYVVREGDSLSQIAEMFGVTTNTILWANDIARATDIRPGDSLVILPVPGVRHIVKTGDTVESVAKKFKGDVEEIISYNQLEPGATLAVGSTLVIPGGAMHIEAAKPATTNSRTAAGGGSGTAAAGLSHPVPGAIKTQGIHGYNAVDFAGAIGTPIRAAAAGEVIVSKSSGWNGGYGNYVVIRHSNGVQTLYSHLSRNDVGVGAYVAAGQTIGAMGNTGRSTGPHLHFEVRGARNPF
jgi:LysM repeat protein